MSSLRSFNLSVGVPGEDISIQLGYSTGRRGVKDIGGTLYPAFTGVLIQQDGLNATLASGESLDIILGGTNSPTLTAESFVSSNIVYDPASRSLTLPYYGVYQVQIGVAVTYASQSTVSLSFELDGVPTTLSLPLPETGGNNHALVFVRDVQCQAISNVSVTNDGPGSVTVQSMQYPGQTIQTAVEVFYRGAL